MKFLIKWAFRCFLLFLVLLAVLALTFDRIVTSLAESRLRKQTGLEVRLGKLEVRPWSGRAHAERLVIYSPAEFGGGPLVNLAELLVEYDPQLAKERKLHLKVLRFNLAELHIVVNKEGQSNLDGVRRAVERARRGEPIIRPNAPMDFVGLDLLNLSLGKGTWTNLRHSGTPREFDLGIRHEVVQDVKDAKQLVAKLSPIFVRAGLAFFGVGQPSPEAASTNRPAAPKLNEATVPKR